MNNADAQWRPPNTTEVIASMRSSFFGHDRLMHLLEDRLTDLSQTELPEAALLTIILEGPPLSGKGTFAKALARALYGTKNDYHWFDLSSQGRAFPEKPEGVRVALLDRCGVTPPYTSLRELLHAKRERSGMVIHFREVGLANLQDLRDVVDLRRSSLMRNSVLVVAHTVREPLIAGGGWPVLFETLKAEADLCSELTFDHKQICALVDAQLRLVEKLFLELKYVHGDVIEYFAGKFEGSPRHLSLLIADEVNRALNMHFEKLGHAGSTNNLIVQLTIKNGAAAFTIEPQRRMP
jgi:DNA polymerase III delta prime subunit